MDEANLRFYQLPFNAVFDDKIAQEMIAVCRRRSIPVCVNRYIHPDAAKNLPAEIRRP